MKEKEKSKKKEFFCYTLIFIFFILIDQITKFFMIGKNIIVISQVLSFTYVENTGIAFGMASNNGIFIILLNIIILGIVLKFLISRKEKLNYVSKVALVLIISGGISNLIDRILRGYVIDYININLFNFPTFNFADICITVGVIIIVVILVKQLSMEDEKEEEKL